MQNHNEKHTSGLKTDDTFVRAVPHELTPDETARLIALIDADSSTGTIVDSAPGGNAQQFRRSRIRFLDTLEHEWLCNKLTPIAETANRLYRFKIFSIRELQLAFYDEGDKGFYDWHLDISPGNMFRKISISILLNDPSEFEGGDVEFYTGGQLQRAVRSNTAAVVFPSFMIHRVTPVTRGRRYVLITWIEGDDWQ